MSKYTTLIAQIAANIRRNGAQEITGDLLQEQLLAMITSLGEHYQFGGLASPSAEFTPGDEPVVFIAATPGTYTNFGGLVVADNEVALLIWSGSAWSKQTTDIATRSEVSQLGQQVLPLYFSVIIDKNINNIEELYLTGLNASSVYKIRINRYGGSKDVFIMDESNSTIAGGSFLNSTLVVITERNSSGINGYAVVRNQDIAEVYVENAATLNNANVSNINNSPTIKSYIESLGDVDYPKFSAVGNVLRDTGLAGKFFGFPFLIPTYSQREDIIVSTLGELYLEGIDRTSEYYLWYNVYNGTKYVILYNSTKSTILAQGAISDNLVYLAERNSSGISGFLLYKGSIGDFAISLYVRIANEYCRNKMYSPTIQNAIKYFDLSTVTSNNLSVFGKVEELYIEGINNGMYSLCIGYDSGISTQVFQIYSNSTVVLQGVRKSAEQKLVELYKVGSSNLYGVIMFDGSLTFSMSEGIGIDNTIVRDVNNSPIIRQFISNNPITVGKTAGYYHFSSILRAVLKATEKSDSTIIVSNGEYDLEQEFKDYYGNDFFDNFQHNVSPEGIILKNRVHIICSSGSKIVFNYSGNNPDVKQWFCPFVVPMDNSIGGGFTLENATIEASNCRYCVHDERGTATDSYKNKYINCSMKIDNSHNGLGYPVCIGGGLGVYGNIEIRGCKFESASYGVRSNGIASYHNSSSGDAKSRMIVQDNYCVGLGTFKFSWYGTSTKITEILVSGNSVGSQIDVMAETEQSIVENIEVLQWNNEVRS